MHISGDFRNNFSKLVLIEIEWKISDSTNTNIEVWLPKDPKNTFVKNTLLKNTFVCSYKNCLRTKYFDRKESFVKHTKKIYWICYSDQVYKQRGTFIRWKMYLITLFPLISAPGVC